MKKIILKFLFVLASVFIDATIHLLINPTIFIVNCMSQEGLYIQHINGDYLL